MDLKQLEYFKTVVEEGSISGAARKLHMSQPPLSMQMKLLEEELGIILLERGNRSITVTDAGKMLYERALSILDLSESAKKELKDFGNGVEGTLRLGMISSSGTEPICERICRFSKKYPKVFFEIYEGSTPQLIEQLRQGRIDLTLLRTPFPTEGLACHFFEEEPMMAMGIADYFTEPDAKEMSLEQLKDVPIIIYRRWEQAILRAFHESGIEPYVICKNDDARTTAMLAESGIGVGILPQSAVFRNKNKEICMKQIANEQLHTVMGIAAKKEGYLSGAARRFLEEFIR